MINELYDYMSGERMLSQHVLGRQTEYDGLLNITPPPLFFFVQRVVE